MVEGFGCTGLCKVLGLSVVERFGASGFQE